MDGRLNVMDGATCVRAVMCQCCGRLNVMDGATCERAVMRPCCNCPWPCCICPQPHQSCPHCSRPLLVLSKLGYSMRGAAQDKSPNLDFHLVIVKIATGEAQLQK